MPSVFELLAVWGAIIATLSLGWQVIDRLWSRRLRLNVRVEIGTLHGAYQGSSVVTFEAHNVGSRTAYLEQCGIINRKGVRLLASLGLHPRSPTLPAELKPGQGFSSLITADAFCKNVANGDFEAFTHAYFLDAVGRHHKKRVDKVFHKSVVDLCTEKTSATAKAATG